MKLKISSYQFDKLIDDTCTLTGVFDLDLNIEEANQAWSKHLIYSIDAIIGRNFRDFFYDRHDAEIILNLINREEIVTGLTIHLLDKEGNPCWIKCNIGRDRDKIIILAIDISSDVFNNKTLQKVSNVVNVGGWSHNPNTDQTFWSEELFKILEIPLSTELTRDTLRQFIHPSYKITYDKAVQNLYENKENYNILLKVITANTNEKWIQLITEIELFNNEIIYIRGILNDVTTIQNALIEVEELKETMEMALKGMQSGYFVHYLDTDKLSYSEYFRNKIGIDYCTDEFTFRKLIHPEDVEAAYNRHLIEIEKENNLYHNHYRIKNLDGNYKYYEVHGWKLRDESGKPFKMIGNLIDVHDKVVSQLKAKKQHAQIKTILENDSMSSVLLNKDFEIIMADKASYSFIKKEFGIDAEKNVTHFKDVVPTHEKSSFKKDLAALKEGKVIEKEISHAGSDGKLRWFNISYHPVKNSEDAIDGYVMSFLNITERIKAIHALQRAKKRLTESIRLKNNIINNMNHEIRTPLNGIVGAAELLEDLIESEEEQELIDFQKKSADRLLSTLESLIYYSVLEANKHSFNLKEINLYNFMMYCYARSKDFAIQNNVTLNLANFEQDSTITNDLVFLRQSVLNLIHNAIKFSKNGNVEIIGIYQEDQIAIAVKDDGVGIAQAEQERIFKYFEQEKGGLDRPFEGNGMGLTFTKKFIETIGGQLVMESEKGVGSLFTIYLPKPNH